MKSMAKLAVDGVFSVTKFMEQLCIYPQRYSAFGSSVLLGNISNAASEGFNRVRSLKKKENVYRPDILIYNIFQKAALKNNAGNIGLYVIPKLMNYVRPLIKSGIKDGRYEMVPELRKLCGNNFITRYIDSLELVSSGMFDTRICEHRCKEKYGYIFRTKDSDGMNWDWSVAAMSPSFTGQERFYKHNSAAVNSGDRSFVHRINDVAVLYARAAIFNALSEYLSGASKDDAVYCKIKGIAKASVQKFKLIDGRIVVREEGMSWAEKVLDFLGVDIPLTTDREGKRVTYELCPTEVSLNREILSLFGLVSTDVLECRGRVPFKWLSTFDSHIEDAFELLLNRAEAIENIRKYERSQGSDYAKSYEEKKHIPKYIQEKMETSGFLNSFGYVEFDEDCDMGKVELVCKEWEDVKSYFYEGCKEDASLRFRKLGNHKASGLYYPFFKCVCVDIRTPSSMIHEVFHMLDHEGGYLSDKYDFSIVLELYETCLRKAMDADASLADMLKGSTKYNLEYYLTPTEVFARCGEMYMSRVVGLKTSLLSEEYSGFAYPHDETLEVAVKSYFDNFFCVKQEEKRKVRAGEA